MFSCVRLSWQCCLLTFSCFTAVGCNRYFQLSVNVLDLESKKPIQGAKVQVLYEPRKHVIAFFEPRFPPEPSNGRTDSSGKAVLKVAEDAGGGIIHVEAFGYEGDS